MTRKVNGSATVTGLERRLARDCSSTRGDPRLRLVLWNGEELRASDDPPIGRVVLRDRRVILDLALHPDTSAWPTRTRADASRSRATWPPC